MPISDAISAAMRQTNDLFNAEVASKRNFEALDRVYTADARILPPGAQMIEGRAQIKSFWATAVAGMDVKSVTLATVHADAAGDGVVEIGRGTSVCGVDSGKRTNNEARMTKELRARSASKCRPRLAPGTAHLLTLISFVLRHLISFSALPSGSVDTPPYRPALASTSTDAGRPASVK